MEDEEEGGEEVEEADCVEEEGEEEVEEAECVEEVEAEVDEEDVELEVVVPTAVVTPILF